MPSLMKRIDAGIQYIRVPATRGNLGSSQEDVEGYTITRETLALATTPICSLRNIEFQPSFYEAVPLHASRDVGRSLTVCEPSSALTGPIWVASPEEIGGRVEAQTSVLAWQAAPDHTTHTARILSCLDHS